MQAVESQELGQIGTDISGLAEDMVSAEEDEYSDDQDVGFTRQRVRDQHHFVAHEVDLSDNDSSTRGTSLYHRAQSQKSSELVHIRLWTLCTAQVGPHYIWCIVRQLGSTCRINME